jgi:hypothetical protein
MKLMQFKQSNLFYEQRRIVAYLDGLQAKVNALRDLQSASGEDISGVDVYSEFPVWKK